MNYALPGIPEEQVRYHVCWGSWNAPHTTDVPLPNVSDLMLKMQGAGLLDRGRQSAARARMDAVAGREAAGRKILIPGLVTHATNVVEHPELVAWRIKNFASVVGRENVIAGTDCGFAQNYNIVRGHPSVQWAKLEALVEGAALASKDLWGR